MFHVLRGLRSRGSKPYGHYSLSLYRDRTGNTGQFSLVQNPGGVFYSGFPSLPLLHPVFLLSFLILLYPSTHLTIHTSQHPYPLPLFTSSHPFSLLFQTPSASLPPLLVLPFTPPCILLLFTLRFPCSLFHIPLSPLQFVLPSAPPSIPNFPFIFSHLSASLTSPLLPFPHYPLYLLSQPSLLFSIPFFSRLPLSSSSYFWPPCLSRVIISCSIFPELLRSRLVSASVPHNNIITTLPTPSLSSLTPAQQPNSHSLRRHPR